MTTRIAALVFILIVAACRISGNSSDPEVVTLSETHRICLIAHDITLESEERAVDYDYGIISSKNGITTQYYVSSEPGRAGSGHIVSTRALGQHTAHGKPIIEEQFSDGNRSLRIDGFTSGIDGKPKIHVKFDFSSKSDSEFMLARRLIDAVDNCAPSSKATP